MKRTLISFAISSVLGLSACSQEAGVEGQLNADANASNNTTNTQTEAKAQLKLAVKFPDSGQAQAALIDTTASVIVVKIRSTPEYTADALMPLLDFCAPYGSGFEGGPSNFNQEDIALCESIPNNNAFNNLRTVATVQLDPVNSTATVDVPVGKYEIMAYQYENDVDMIDGRRLAGTKSFANLTAGSHSVALTFTHGTWDFVDSAGTAAPLDFQLLNNAAVMTDLGVTDADPLTAGDQLPGEVLGLDGGSLTGFHLVDHRYLFRKLGEAEKDKARAGDFYDSNRFENLFPQLVTIPRIADTAGVETDVFPMFQGDGFDQCCNGQTDPDFFFGAGPVAGFHIQQYDGIQNTNSLVIADHWMEYEDRINDTWFNAGIFVKTAYDPIFSNHVDDGTSHNYDITDNEDENFIDTRTVNTPSGTTTLTIVQAGTETGTFTHPNTDTAVTAHPDTSLTNGTTISGTLFEVVGYSVPLASTIGGTPSYTGPAPVTGTGGGSSATTQAQRAISQAYQLEMLARDSGLKASAAASAFGANCVEVAEAFSWTWSEFLWDETTTSWIPGSFNWSYNYNSFNQTVNGSDWDDDGIIEPFESAYWNQVPEYTGVDNYDPVTGAYIDTTFSGNANRYQTFDFSTNSFKDFYSTTVMNCAFDSISGDTLCTDTTTAVTNGTHFIDPAELTIADADGDGIIEERETIPVQENETGTVHICAHEFTLQGRQLDLEINPTDTTVVVN